MFNSGKGILGGGILGFLLFRGIVPAIANIVFVLYMCYLAWICLGPTKPVLDAARMRVADKMVTQMVEDIRNHRGDVRSAELLHFANDPTDYFSNALRHQLVTNGILDVPDRSMWSKLCARLNLREDTCDTIHEALEEVDPDDVDGVLWGKLDRFETFNGGVLLNGEWYLLDAKAGSVLYSGTLAMDTTSPLKQAIADATKMDGGLLESTAHLIPWYIRLLGFILSTLLLPIVTIAFIRTMVAKRSNKVNAFLLGTYTAIDAILAFFMIGGAFVNGWTTMLFLAATAFAFIYNLILMNFALKLES